MADQNSALFKIGKPLFYLLFPVFVHRISWVGHSRVAQFEFFAQLLFQITNQATAPLRFALRTGTVNEQDLLFHFTRLFSFLLYKEIPGIDKKSFNLDRNILKGALLKNFTANKKTINGMIVDGLVDLN